MIKDFTPARSGLATGVVIKQHLLERNRQRPAQVEISQYDYSGSVYSQQMWDPITSGTYVSNSKISKIEGGAGGAFNDVNNLGSNPEGQSQGIKNTLAPFVTQSWTYEIQTLSGSLIVTQSTQDEFYNGELQGTKIEATDGELNDWNNSKYPSTLEIDYIPYLYISNTSSLDLFNNINTSPNAGEIYLWYDTGSTTNPGTGIPPLPPGGR
jgi:hypothetical protein